MNAKFIHLRTVSSYSLCFGASSVADLVAKAKREEMPALAIADKNNLFASLEFAMEAVKNSLQPIHAVAQKLSLLNKDKDDILLIATNKTGYQNLLKISSLPYLAGNIAGIAEFANIEQYNQGIIALIGSRAGALYNYLLYGQYDKAEELVDLYQTIYSNNLFLELSRLSYEDEVVVEPLLLKLALKKNIPIVATNDVRYIESSSYEAQDILSCIAEGEYFTNTKRKKSSPEHFFKTEARMKRLFKDLPEAIENTELIAKKCSFFVESKEPSLPSFPIEGSRDEGEELVFQAKAGLEIRIKQHGIAEGKIERYNKRFRI